MRPETKAVETLRRAQRDADERAREAMREASQLIQFSNEIEQKVRELTEVQGR